MLTVLLAHGLVLLAPTALLVIAAVGTFAVVRTSRRVLVIVLLLLGGSAAIAYSHVYPAMAWYRRVVPLKPSDASTSSTIEFVAPHTGSMNLEYSFDHDEAAPAVRGDTFVGPERAEWQLVYVRSIVSQGSSGDPSFSSWSSTGARQFGVGLGRFDVVAGRKYVLNVQLSSAPSFARASPSLRISPWRLPTAAEFVEIMFLTVPGWSAIALGLLLPFWLCVGASRPINSPEQAGSAEGLDRNRSFALSALPPARSHARESPPPVDRRGYPPP